MQWNQLKVVEIVIVITCMQCEAIVVVVSSPKGCECGADLSTVKSSVSEMIEPPPPACHDPTFPGIRR